MRTLINLVESPESDAATALKARQTVLTVCKAIYYGAKADHHVELGNYGQFLLYDAERLGLTTNSPELKNLAIMLGLKNPKAIGLSGAFMRFGETIMGRYDRAIMVYGLTAIEDSAAKVLVNSTEFMRVFEHEFIHLLDGDRTSGKSFPKLFIDPAKPSYFNDPAEFNAFFHNLSDAFTSILNAAKDGKACHYAELYGYSGEFLKDVSKLTSGYSIAILKRFVKSLTDDRRKAMWRRLYKLHQAVNEALAKEKSLNV